MSNRMGNIHLHSLISLAPSFRVISCLTIEVCPRLRSSLAKTSAYSLKICLISCWSLGFHLMHPKRSTFSSTSCSEIEIFSSRYRDTGVSKVSSFLVEFKQEDQPACDGSFEGRTSIVCLRAFILGTISAICTLPFTILVGILTSKADKFLNIIPTLLEPG